MPWQWSSPSGGKWGRETFPETFCSPWVPREFGKGEPRLNYVLKVLTPRRAKASRRACR
jgi:hypothetical protein